MDQNEENIRQEFKDFVNEWVKSSAEQHCEIHKDRYYTKSQKQIEEDLYINHDETLEIEFVQDNFKGATEEEIEYYLGRFKEECLIYMGYEPTEED